MKAFEIISRSEPTFHFVKEFCECADRVRRDPYRIGLLPSIVWETFLKMKMPQPTEFWICHVGGKGFGRIGANISSTYPGIGYIGFFEMDTTMTESKDAAKALIEAASLWLKSKGAKKVYGPLNFNTWFPYRFRVGDQDNLRFTWEPVNPPEYARYLTNLGFKELETYHTVANQGLSGLISKTKDAHTRALGAGYTVRPFDTGAIMSKEVPILYDISMAGFKDNFLFEPIPLEAFKQLYVPIANKTDVTLARAVTDSNGKDVGFFLIFEDHGYMVLKSVAVKPEGRGKGLSNAMVYSAATAAKEKGLDLCISALVKSGAQSESYAKKGNFLWKHEYALYQRDL